MPTRRFDTDDSALAAIAADTLAICAARLARLTGTHALLLDGIAMPVPSVTGVARWTGLRPGPAAEEWQGPLRASAAALPFGDESFCAVLVRFPGRADIAPGAIAAELARVLAPHGVLLVVDLHPRSLWRTGAAPGTWERALRGAGLELSPVLRCGSPWPRARGTAGIPGWLVRGMGGAWVLEARRSKRAAIPLRRAAPGRRAVEHNALLPGAHRKSLNGLLRSATAVPAVLAMLAYWRALRSRGPQPAFARDGSSAFPPATRMT